MYSYFAILSILSAAVCVGLGLFALSRNWRQPANIGFALGMLCLAVIEVGGGIVLYSSTNGEAALSGMRLALSGESFLPATWLLFSVFFARKNYRHLISRWSPVIAAAFVAAIFFSLKSGSSGFVSIQSSGDARFIFTIGTLGRYFYIYLIIGLVLNLVNLENSLRSSEGEERLRIKYVIFGVGAILFFYIYHASQALLFSTINIQTLPLTSAVVLISASMMALFIVKHRLLETDIYISRYIIFNSLTVLTVGIYLITIGLVTQGIKYFNVPFNYFFSTLFTFISVLLLIIVFFNDTFRTKVKFFINKNFYKHKYDFRDSWNESIEKISTKTSEEEIQKTLKIMILKYTGAKPFHMWLNDAVSRKYHAVVPEVPKRYARIDPTHPIIGHIKKWMEPFVLKNIDFSTSGQNDKVMKKFVKDTSAVLCVPLIAGQEIMGFILQGEDISGQPYNQDDFELLKAVTTQAAVQIKNTRLAQDLIAAKEIDAFSKMSSFIMHDLKNLTNSLSLLSQNARYNMDNPEFQKDALTTIDKTISRMKGLIEKLSTVRKGVKLKRETAEPGALIYNAINKMTPTGEKNVIITKNIGPLPTVFVDPESIEMVVLNILTNAYDAIQREGKIDITAALNGKNINIKISDTGAGMSDEFIAKGLFRPFKSTKKHGFGIGLYQSKDVVEAHGGRIEVESSEGKGTTFTLILPVHQANGAG